MPKTGRFPLLETEPKSVKGGYHLGGKFWNFEKNSFLKNCKNFLTYFEKKYNWASLKKFKKFWKSCKEIF